MVGEAVVASPFVRHSMVSSIKDDKPMVHEIRSIARIAMAGIRARGAGGGACVCCVLCVPASRRGRPVLD